MKFDGWLGVILRPGKHIMNHPTIEQLALELLGKTLEELETEEARVLEAIRSRNIMARDVVDVCDANAGFGDRLADRVAAIGGSWAFIIGFGVVLVGWMLLNSGILSKLGLTFDPYPYIFLNLMLSMLAAIQAPVIMMSQNRQADKDRIAASHDYQVNLHAELEIKRLHAKIDGLVEVLRTELRNNQAGH